MKFEIRCKPEPAIYCNGKIWCSFAFMDGTMAQKMAAAEKALEALNAANV